MDARSIYEAHLRSASEAALAGNFEGVMATFALPCQFILADGEMVVTSADELRRALADYAGRLQAEGVVEEREWCTSAELVSGMSGVISGRHVTEWHFADGRPPHQFSNQAVLTSYRSGWKLLWIRSDLALDHVEVLSTEFIAKQARMLQERGLS